ncbi:hypothetical protein BJY01DRAFT_29182 [Aspergillus pseudoustus]|uniref:Uncharacterized protein n=1 Tax=Aspergillus pseudoustus TaxID=1810923 RepID=A0ABR4JGD2_9EURO
MGRSTFVRLTRLRLSPESFSSSRLSSSSSARCRRMRGAAIVLLPNSPWYANIRIQGKGCWMKGPDTTMVGESRDQECKKQLSFHRGVAQMMAQRVALQAPWANSVPHCQPRNVARLARAVLISWGLCHKSNPSELLMAFSRDRSNLDFNLPLSSHHLP